MARDNEQDRIEKQLQLIVKLLAATVVERKTFEEGAKFLDGLGLDRNTIAEVYETTPPSVRSAVSRARRGLGKKTKKRSI